MKKIVIGALALFSLTAQAQKKKPVVKKAPVRAAAGTAKPLKNITDSASYALGLSVANFYKQQGFKNLNTSLIAQAINDVQAGKKPIFTEEDANETIMFFMNPELRTTIEEGKRFMAQNKAKQGIKTTASGIQYEVLKESTGAKPKAFDTVVVNYVGTLLNGTEFDNSVKRGQPVEFKLNQVIKGWTEGLQLMSVGSKYKFYIPYNLAYGLNGNGPIPGGATLVFEVELLNIKPSI
ncbi:MAG: FKBP-type peptidyl-prolyl cis-trans isomerase [Chitinophagaceae bacterium]|nr:MAG: FKBP-type peptidyl-prolyl cis-trans isomerase [Chitinophagaceae bacterium]